MASDETITSSEGAPQDTSPTPEPSPSKGFNLLSALNTPAGRIAGGCVLAASFYVGLKAANSGQAAAAAFSALFLLPSSVAVMRDGANLIKDNWKILLASSLVIAGTLGGVTVIVEPEIQREKRIAALPELDPKTVIDTRPLSAREVYCRGQTRGTIEVNDPKRNLVGLKLNCGT
jgi:putative effector of murein hydrolase LrgA (UPF0299 family)